MAGMTAIVLHDLGSRPESRAWFATAARAAAESGDDQLHAWVLAREAKVPLNYGAPKAAAGLAERARHVAGHRRTAAATLAAAVAAPRLRPQPSERAGPRRARGRRRPHGPAPRGRAIGHVADVRRAEAPRHLSHAFSTLGDTRLAHVSQERALELPAPTSTMTHTLLNIDAAACSHHDGETEQACRRTVDALAGLPVDYRTGLVRRRALDLYEAIPAQHHHERAVRELRDVVDRAAGQRRRGSHRAARFRRWGGRMTWCPTLSVNCGCAASLSTRRRRPTC
ncbi:hypothetical protein AB0D91_46345 [Streptomyces canus]|uniref:hypothetical protein n=1 Tax=Streptomyces canus TaxID=58343 RepID=UPI0034039E6B